MRSSYRLKSGQRPNGPGGRYDGTFVQDFEYVPGAGDLDECNGRFGATHEFPQGIYHYLLTDTYPFVPRKFKGQPDESFMTRGGKHPGFGGPPPGFGPGRRGFPPPGGRGGFGPPGGPGQFGPPDHDHFPPPLMDR